MTKPPRDPEKVKQHAERRRRRLLYSLNDLQQALSACSFLYECDEQGTYSKPELRRFRCYETTLVAAYGRPFSQSLAGGIPPLSTKMIGLKLSPERRALHDRLIGDLVARLHRTQATFGMSALQAKSGHTKFVGHSTKRPVAI